MPCCIICCPPLCFPTPASLEVSYNNKQIKMSLYTPVKYALLIILTVGLVMLILNLAPELQRRSSNTNLVIMAVVQLVVLLIGLVGSYRDNRQLLLTFAIILTIIVIVSVVQSQAIAVVSNAVLDIICILLAFYQSEMIRSGDF